MGFPGTYPEYVSQGPILDRVNSFQGLGSIAKVLQVSMKDTLFFHQLKHLPGFRSIPAQWFGNQDGFPGFGCNPDRFQVLKIGKGHHNSIDTGMTDRFFHISGPVWDPVSFSHPFCTGFTSGIDHLHQVGPAVTMQGMNIEISYKTATEHGYFSTLDHSNMFC